jgi:hypothetical protein
MNADEREALVYEHGLLATRKKMMVLGKGQQAREDARSALILSVLRGEQPLTPEIKAATIVGKTVN